MERENTAAYHDALARNYDRRREDELRQQVAQMEADARREARRGQLASARRQATLARTCGDSVSAAHWERVERPVMAGNSWDEARGNYAWDFPMK